MQTQFRFIHALKSSILSHFFHWILSVGQTLKEITPLNQTLSVSEINVLTLKAELPRTQDFIQWWVKLWGLNPRSALGPTQAATLHNRTDEIWCSLEHLGIPSELHQARLGMFVHLRDWLEGSGEVIADSGASQVHQSSSTWNRLVNQRGSSGNSGPV